MARDFEADYKTTAASLDELEHGSGRGVDKTPAAPSERSAGEQWHGLEVRKLNIRCAAVRCYYIIRRSDITTALYQSLVGRQLRYHCYYLMGSLCCHIPICACKWRTCVHDLWVYIGRTGLLRDRSFSG